jgi:hypothetical protein
MITGIGREPHHFLIVYAAEISQVVIRSLKVNTTTHTSVEKKNEDIYQNLQTQMIGEQVKNELSAHKMYGCWQNVTQGKGNACRWKPLLKEW